MGAGNVSIIPSIGNTDAEREELLEGAGYPNAQSRAIIELQRKMDSLDPDDDPKGVVTAVQPAAGIPVPRPKIPEPYTTTPAGNEPWKRPLNK